MTKEQKFYNALKDIFVGAKVEGESGYINLMRIKSRYYEKGVFPKLQEDVEEAIKPFPDFKEELFDKLYTFFHRYFSESGSIYFRYTPLHQNIYEKVYTDDKDVMLFYKTHMLYYVKSDRLFKSLEVELPRQAEPDTPSEKGNIDGYKFFFDVSTLEHKRANEKRETIYELKEIRKDDVIAFNVRYTEKGRTTKLDEIMKTLRKAKVIVDEDLIEKAFRVFEKQSEVDYFINKNAKEFLREQFNIWLYQYVFSGESEFSEKRIKQLQALKDIAFKVIDFISQFEDELVKIWNKPKFVLNSNYVITLDRIVSAQNNPPFSKGGEGGFELLQKILNHKNIKKQIKEWQELGITNDDFDKEDIIKTDLTGKHLNDKYQHLPLDTKYFKDLELEILGLFNDLDNSLDGWLIKSENYQALNTILPKFKGKVKCVYIDPPYNAATSEIHYVNTYKDSSWITLMENRIFVSKELLSKEFVYMIAIDDVEQRYLGDLLKQYMFPENSVNCIIVVHNQRGQQGKNLSAVHEYVYFMYPDDTNKYLNDREMKEIDHRNLRDSGTESMRTDAKNCFYPIFVKDGKIIGFGDVATDDYHPSGVNEVKRDGMIYVWPIDTDGHERKWRYARQSVEEILNDLEVKETKSGIQIYFNKKSGTIRTVWQDEKYDASEYGTKTLQDMFGRTVNSEFQYPKSIYLVEDSIKAVVVRNTSSLIILDFFGGSGTTAHAVINLNRQDSIRRRYILVEMAEYFDTVLLPRVKKAIFSDKWGNGKALEGKGISHFIKYYSLEQYEDTLRRVKYEDADLFENPSRDPYNQYIFLKDLKLLEALEINYKKNKVKVDLSKLYDTIDIPETLSNLLGKWIKKITPDYVEFQDGEKIDLKDLDYKLIKPLIWW
jgi:adenine specific DNA methylase Mod